MVSLACNNKSFERLCLLFRIHQRPNEEVDLCRIVKVRDKNLKPGRERPHPRGAAVFPCL